MIISSAFSLVFPELLAQAASPTPEKNGSWDNGGWGGWVAFGIVLITCVILIVLLVKSKGGTKTVPSADELRGKLAQVVTMWAMAVIVILGIIMLLITGYHAVLANNKEARDQFIDTGKYIFAAIVPVVAAWVGTVMAFYFGKENFKAATDSMSQIARQFTSQDKLGQTPVEKIGKAISDIDTLRVPEGKTNADINLEDVRAKMVTPSPPFERLPILTAKGAPHMVVHRSVLTDFLLKKKEDPDAAVKAKTAKDFSLSELVTDQSWLETDSYGTVGSSASAADAKNVMAQHAKCADVFVTADGKPTGTVTRWITNIDLLQAAQV
jgi:hypothetical protein